MLWLSLAEGKVSKMLKNDIAVVDKKAEYEEYLKMRKFLLREVEPGMAS